jgi:DNA polymerase I
MGENKIKRLIVIDCNALIHRAFHALPPLTTKNKEAVNAVYGFLLVFLKAIKEFNPDYVVATFDFPAKTFRHKEYKEYKATRVKAPEELYQQIPKVKGVLEKFGVPIYEKEGYEADDLIGTISNTASASGRSAPEIETIILTGDYDALQLVNSRVNVYALSRGVKEAVLYDEEKVKQKYGGLGSEQLVDFKALRGDPSDNIPGVFGIGEKTAIMLIEKFKTLENLYKELENNSPEIQKLRELVSGKLSENKEKAFISKMLSRIKCDVPINFDLDKCRWGSYDKDEVVKMLNDYEFRSLINRLPGAKPEPKNGTLF